jgi:hypothetical protein
MENNKNIPSYSLIVRISPNWDNVYKKICKKSSDEDFKNDLQEKIKNIDKNDLYGSIYEFTEYFDSASGLTTLFQKIERKNEEVRFSDTWEFGENGCIFKSDDNSLISVSESGIQKMVWDVDSYLPMEYLFNFPVEPIFNFLIHLNKKLHNYGVVFPVIKWPDGIENLLKDAGIKYNHPNSFDPVSPDSIIDIEKSVKDQDFFNEMGKPIIANEYATKMGFFSSEMIKEASITMKIFEPNENSRFHEHVPTDWLRGKDKK